MNSVGSRHPGGRLAGLIYLDGGYSYAYYDRSRGDLGIDLVDLQKKLEQLQPGNGPQDPMRTFNITPDGKQIVFDRLRENSAAVLIDLRARRLR
jgi:hypothetical protein